MVIYKHHGDMQILKQVEQIMEFVLPVVKMDILPTTMRVDSNRVLLPVLPINSNPTIYSEMEM